MSSDLNCPVCGAALSLEVVFSDADARQALDRLVTLSVPLGARVLKYLGLHKPPRQHLTAAKKIKLLLQLLPDLERGAVRHKGRDWAVSQTTWAAAFDQVCAAADAGGLDLPLKGHGYLYAVVSGLADKAEARAEAQREADRRTAPAATAHTVTLRGQVMPVAEALQTLYGAPKLGAENPAPVPAGLREQLQRLRGGAQQANGGGV